MKKQCNKCKKLTEKYAENTKTGEVLCEKCFDLLGYEEDRRSGRK